LERKREIILMISVGGGLRIPLMEGDKLRIGSREGKAVYYWVPLGHDGKTLDLSRAKKGKRSERYLHPRFIASLHRGNHLVAVNATDFEVRAAEIEAEPVGEGKQPEAVRSGVREKRKPLLRRHPVWGLPPRWH
jgi:hypothetical protein